MPQLKQLNMENIDMWRHPKYYKELRKAGNELAQASAVKEDLTGSSSSPARNKSDRAISLEDSTESVCGVRPGPGHKRKRTSVKPQATKTQASESKTQAPSCEVQASSHKHQAP
jgi:hypothetical protein